MALSLVFVSLISHKSFPDPSVTVARRFGRRCHQDQIARGRLRCDTGAQRGGFTAAFINFNRNKRSIVIDVKKEHGRDLVRRLATRADALVENNRPGVADRLGIGYADIRRTN